MTSDHYIPDQFLTFKHPHDLFRRKLVFLLFYQTASFLGCFIDFLDSILIYIFKFEIEYYAFSFTPCFVRVFFLSFMEEDSLIPFNV
jgi:hypothetical protein